MNLDKAIVFLQDKLVGQLRYVYDGHGWPERKIVMIVKIEMFTEMVYPTGLRLPKKVDGIRVYYLADEKLGHRWYASSLADSAAKNILKEFFKIDDLQQQ